jgi:hypothetical protein
VNRASRTCALLALVAPASMAADPPAKILGLWLHHDAWELAPASVRETNPGSKSASAAMINFCPRGELRLATGVVYQSDGSDGVGIGASDGLAIYRGRWSLKGDVIVVEYRLVSAEFGNLSNDPVASAKRNGELRPKGRKLDFPFTTIRGKTWPLELTAARDYGKQLEDWHVECPPTPR